MPLKSFCVYITDYAPGIYNIGTHYFAGKGVEPDMKKAAECFHKAADEGFVLAQVRWIHISLCIWTLFRHMRPWL